MISSMSWKTFPHWWVKTVHESGGYGMLMGPYSSQLEQTEFRKKIEANPRNFIAQPVVQLSHHPCITDGKESPTLMGRHSGFAPFCFMGERCDHLIGRAHEGRFEGGVLGREFFTGRGK